MTKSAPMILGLVVASLAVAGTVAAFLAIEAIADDEARRAPATCRNERCYCEDVAAAGVRQPINAWSSLAPALGGAVILVLAFGRRKPPNVPSARSRMPSAALAAAACAIAIFSFHYHASLSWLGEWLDGVALYVIAGFGIAWRLASLSTTHRTRSFVIAFALLAAIPAAIVFEVPGARKLTFVVLVVAAIAVEAAFLVRTRPQIRYRALIVAVCSFALGSTAWLLDWHDVVCDSSSPFQLHAVWHVMSAPVVVAIDRHYAALGFS